MGSESLLLESNHSLTAQAFGVGLRHILSCLDKDVSQAVHGELKRNLTPLGLWTWVQPWAWQIEELASVCQCGTSNSRMPHGIDLLERLFNHCQARQTSVALIQACSR